MASNRVQRQIASLLAQAETSMKRLEWRVVHNRAAAVLAIDHENSDGLTYLATAERAMVALRTASSGSSSPVSYGISYQKTSMAFEFADEDDLEDH